MRLLRALVCVLVLAIAVPVSLAKNPKKYQVTGTVLELSDDMIIVQKGEERWELSREESTKVDGKLAVGEKVTIEYRMAATDIEVKKTK